MSHFTVTVISKKNDSIEDIMAPYQESPENPEYLTFTDMEKEYKKEWQNKKITVVKMKDGTYVFPWDEQFRVKDTFGIGSDTHKVPENLKEIDVPLKKFYKTFDEFCKKWRGRSRDKNGKIGYWENKDAKWDWYEIGGRWEGMLILKDGKTGKKGEKSWTNKDEQIPENRVSQARKGDIDFEAMREEQIKMLEKNWEEAQGKDEKERAFIYGIKKGMTKEEYCSDIPTFSTFAVIKDGEWFEKGKMGWWAIVDNEKKPAEWKAQFQKLIDDLDDDDIITILDCHI